MDIRTREVLDFDPVLELIAGRAACSLGAEFVQALEPAGDEALVHARLAPVRELLGLLSRGASLPLGGLFDATVLFQRAAIPGAMLEVEDWPRLLVFLDVSHRVIAFRDRVAPEAAVLGRALAPLTGNEELKARIERTFDSNGGVRDDASNDLWRLRRMLRSAEQALFKMVNRLAIELHDRGVLQEAYSTVRNGRHVFPVKSNHKGRLGGIVHGSSGSGETVFVEPAEVVESSNEIESIREEEQREVARILAELTAQLLPWVPAGQANLDVLRRLDGWGAIAKTAYERNWCIPHVGGSAAVRLFNAHHPLLSLTAPAASVPITMLLDRDDRCLVLSGPNAGGKTTAMKMLGLVASLVQCGCPVPVFPDSTLPVFDHILADIGDQQDIGQGISTFSGHVRRIAEMWSDAGDCSLVLLDELGTGTDPQEGGAIALAILEAFATRARLTITTSHLNPVKQWAEDSPGVRNASFSLDAQTRRPTFKLRLDLPGASEALDTAAREGLPQGILDRARELVGTRQLEMGDLLRRIEEREQALAATQREAEARALGLEQQEALARARAEMLQAERLEQREKSLEEKDRLLGELRDRVEKMIAGLPGEEELRRRKEELSITRDLLLDDQRSARSERARLNSANSVDSKLPAGRKIFVKKLGQWGEVVSVDDSTGKVRLLVGDMEVTARLDDLIEEDPRQKREELRAITDQIAAEASGKKLRAKKRKRSVREALRDAEAGTNIKFAGRPLKASGSSVNASRPTGMTLDLHGMRVEEALAEVDKFLDRSLLANFPHVKLCHGTGTGRLYRAIHDYLRTHPAARKFRFGTPEEGGGGVTIVEF